MTLTQTAILVKQLIIVSIIALFLTTGGFVGYKIWYANYLANLPPVEEKPDMAWGVLPPPDFPKSQVSSSNFTYSLDTATGNLPILGKEAGFEKIIKVYFITRTFATFLSPEKSSALAEKFGIIALPEIISETEYAFTENSRNLLVNLDNGNFSYLNESTQSAKENLDDDNKLVSDFIQTISSLGILKDDLKNGRTKVTRTSSNRAQISLWQGQVDKKDVFTPDFNRALINSEVIKGPSNINDFISLNFTYYPIDTSKFATYPVKPPETALEELKNGKGTVIVEPPKPQVSITSVNLGYYMADNYNPYLLPVYVFEGPSFAAYVSAIPIEFQSTAR